MTPTRLAEIQRNHDDSRRCDCGAHEDRADLLEEVGRLLELAEIARTWARDRRDLAKMGLRDGHIGTWEEPLLVAVDRYDTAATKEDPDHG